MYSDIKRKKKKNRTNVYIDIGIYIMKISYICVCLFFPLNGDF